MKERAWHAGIDRGLFASRPHPDYSFLVLFGVLQMARLVIFTNGTIGSQWYHWLTNGTNRTIGRANSTIGITIGTNGITNGTIGKTLNDIGIPLVPLGNPEHTPCWFIIDRHVCLVITQKANSILFKGGLLTERFVFDIKWSGIEIKSKRRIWLLIDAVVNYVNP